MKIDEEKSLAIGTGVILNKIDGEFYEDKIKAYALVGNLISNGARGNVYRVKYISENNNVKDAILKEFFPSENRTIYKEYILKNRITVGLKKSQFGIMVHLLLVPSMKSMILLTDL